jgi:elongation factor 1-beta
MTSPAQLASDVKKLDAYLLTRSYITGYAPSQDDVQALAALAGGKLDAKATVHAFRWHKHITSFSEAERAKFPAGKGAVEAVAPGSPAKPAAAAKPAVAAAAKKEEEDEDDLFGSDTEEDKAREAARKAKVEAHRASVPQKEKPKQRSLIVLEIKPNEIETDLKAMAEEIKKMEHKGIQNWGAEVKLVPVAYGINKLVISVVVFDDDIMVDDIEEMLMEKFGEDIQSVDVGAMSKV